MVARVRSFTSPKFEDELLAEVAGMGWRITRWLHGDFFPLGLIRRSQEGRSQSWGGEGVATLYLLIYLYPSTAREP
jgi:hypothetical protein